MNRLSKLNCTCTMLCVMIIMLMFSCDLSAQDRGRNVSIVKSIKDTNEVIINPSFPGGEVALNNFIIQNLESPAAVNKGTLKGTVYVKFYVEIDGAVSVLGAKESFNKQCEKAAIKMVKKMPNWIPGSIDGIKRRVLITLPVEFK